MGTDRTESMIGRQTRIGQWAARIRSRLAGLARWACGVARRIGRRRIREATGSVAELVRRQRAKGERVKRESAMSGFDHRSIRAHDMRVIPEYGCPHARAMSRQLSMLCQ